MIKYFIYILVFYCLTINAQNKQDGPPPLPVFIDELPEFHGGQKALSDFIYSNLKYPDITKEKKNIGTCHVKIKVEIDGSISDITLIKGIEGCFECDKEAKRIVSIMPKWKPGIKSGQAIAASRIMLIDFSTESKDKTQPLSPEKEDIYTVVEEMPDFPGGITERNKFIQSNIKFPDSAIKKQIMGKCFLKFTIAKDGAIKDITILKGVTNCPECDEEAKRVISIMPRWKPGKQNGHLVSVYYNLPINFQYQ